MTELATKAFGKIDIDPMQIISFQEGLFGFSGYEDFALIEDREDSPFKWLQSVQDTELAFVLIQPELFLAEEYVPSVAKADLEILEAQSVEECLVFAIVTIPEKDPRSMTANLQGPVLINAKKRIGRQAISNNDKHSVRVPILEQLEG